MSDSNPPIDPGSVSRELAAHYHVDLPTDLADWFDDGLWRFAGRHEFSEAVDPRVLLHRPCELIWPGLMPPFFLPLIGNRQGDWLCARVAADGTLRDYVHWYHGGGDWIPWGQRLPEAIVFDALSEHLPGPHHGHAVAAERFHDTASDGGDRWLGWALEQLPEPLDRMARQVIDDADSVDPEDLAEVMLQSQVAEVAVRCQLVQSLLSELDGLNEQDAQPASDQDRGALDRRRTRHRRIERHCLAVTEIAPELAWPWEVWALCRHQRGQSRTAKFLCRLAATRSAFTNQSVRLRTHLRQGQALKLSVAMMDDWDREPAEPTVGEKADAQLLPEGYREALQTGDRTAISDYWIREADRSVLHADPAQALEQLVMSGWDVGTDQLSVYGDLLERVAGTAELAEQFGRAAVARTHWKCFLQRYAEPSAS